MTPQDALRDIIAPALAALGPRFQSREAECELLAIGLQESGLTARVQRGGPAHGLWQFEAGGVRGVLTHPASESHASLYARSRGVDPSVPAIYAALPNDDQLACVFARLLLYTDGAPLPALGDQQAGWDYYAHNWRPGKPRPESWPANYAAALEALT